MIYLDNSATTKQHPLVTEAMIRMMEEEFGNPSALHGLGLEGEKAIKKARATLMEILSDDDGEWNKGNVAFLSGGTEADNMAVFGAARAGRRRGNKIVISAVEHPAVMECCRKLEEGGVKVVRIGVDRFCRLDMEKLEESVDDKTILVSVMQVNNEVGTVMPLEEIAGIIKKKDSPALLHCDAVQSFGKMRLPKGIHMASISGHKIHGPKGSGALCMKKGVNIPPLILGGGQEKGMRSGTENVPGTAGLGVASGIAKDKMDENFRKVEQLRAELLKGLKSEIEDVVVNSLEDSGTKAGMSSPYILNVSFPGTRGEVILHTLEQDGIYVSTGSACSSNKKGRSHVLEAMGCSDREIEGAIRFSFSADNTMEEIEKTVEKTAAAVAGFRRLGSFR